MRVSGACKVSKVPSENFALRLGEIFERHKPVMSALTSHRRTITSFLGTNFGMGVPGDIAKRNKANALGILKSLSEKDSSHLQETCIMAWGQVGR